VQGTDAAPGAAATATGSHSPCGELLYREFVEAVVRLAWLRYPGLPSIDRRLQQVGAAALTAC
jgi:hypothetical protein